MKETLRRRQRVGRVMSDRMNRTVVVRVARLVRHPTYAKVMRRTEKFKADDAGLKARVGDEVRMEETRPTSKDKRWRLVEILRRSADTDTVGV